MLCPTCKRRVEWSSENKWRPFCSERCKLIDLGAWAAEKHAIPAEPIDGEDAELGDQAAADQNKPISKRDA